MAVDRPRAEALSPLAGDVLLQVSGVDPVELPRSQGRNEMTPNDQPAPLTCGALEILRAGNVSHFTLDSHGGTPSKGAASP
jgi:hypothetical protein